MDLFTRASGLMTLAIELITGVRLLVLAMKTRRLPETALGVAFTCGAGTNAWFLIAALLFPEAPPEIEIALWGLSYLGLTMSLYIGVWRVFRPTSVIVRTIGLLLAVTLTTLLVTELAGINRGFYHGVWKGLYDEVQVYAITATMAWAGIESALYYRDLRRQIALGLSESVFAARFRLWSYASVAWVLFHVFLFSRRHGMLSLEFARPTMTFLALIGSVLIYVTFLPPEWLQRRWENEG
ncbi:MAG: hypothetical protein AAF219_02705 [Myxococcota bacterium]